MVCGGPLVVVRPYATVQLYIKALGVQVLAQLPGGLDYVSPMTEASPNSHRVVDRVRLFQEPPDHHSHRRPQLKV